MVENKIFIISLILLAALIAGAFALQHMQGAGSVPQANTTSDATKAPAAATPHSTSHSSASAATTPPASQPTISGPQTTPPSVRPSIQGAGGEQEGYDE